MSTKITPEKLWQTYRDGAGTPSKNSPSEQVDRQAIQDLLAGRLDHDVSQKRKLYEQIIDDQAYRDVYLELQITNADRERGE